MDDHDSKTAEMRGHRAVSLKDVITNSLSAPTNPKLHFSRCSQHLRRERIGVEWIGKRWHNQEPAHEAFTSQSVAKRPFANSFPLSSHLFFRFSACIAFNLPLVTLFSSNIRLTCLFSAPIRYL